MHDDEREYLDFLTQLIHEHQREETRRQIDELFSYSVGLDCKSLDLRPPPTGGPPRSEGR